MDIRPLILGLGLMLAACGDEPAQPDVQVQAAPTPLLAPHPGYLLAGAARPPVDSIPNPFAGDEDAIARGATRYEQYNCVSCHGGEGAGGIGPTLNDPRWKYGGSAAEIFQSIHEGRPSGMPAWGGRIPDAEIWMLVAYVESLGGDDLATVEWPGIPAEGARRTPIR